MSKTEIPNYEREDVQDYKIPELVPKELINILKEISSKLDYLKPRKIVDVKYVDCQKETVTFAGRTYKYDITYLEEQIKSYIKKGYQPIFEGNLTNPDNDYIPMVKYEEG